MAVIDYCLDNEEVITSINRTPAIIPRVGEYVELHDKNYIVKRIYHHPLLIDGYQDALIITVEPLGVKEERMFTPCQFCVFYPKYCQDIRIMINRNTKLQECSEGWNDGVNSIGISKEIPCKSAIEIRDVIDLMKNAGYFDD